MSEVHMGGDIGVTLCLWADDYDKAIKFYHEQTKLFSVVANLTLGPDNRNVVLAYKNPAAPFRLVVYLATTPTMSALVGRQGGDRALFVLPVDDLSATYERLLEAGVPFWGEPFELPYGIQATIIDPFGNKVCLSEMY